MKAYVHLRYLAEFFLEWEMFKDKSCTENQNTHFIFSNFFPNVVAFMTWYMIWERERERESSTAGQSTGDTTRRRRKDTISLPDNQGKNMSTHS